MGQQESRFGVCFFAARITHVGPERDGSVEVRRGAGAGWGGVYRVLSCEHRGGALIAC